MLANVRSVVAPSQRSAGPVKTIDAAQQTAETVLPGFNAAPQVLAGVSHVGRFACCRQGRSRAATCQAR